MKIIDIFNEISSESGTNKKMEILAKYKDNETLKTVLYKGMSKRVKFWIKQVPAPMTVPAKHDLEWALDRLEVLEKRHVTGSDAQQTVAMMLGVLSADDAEVITRVIKKDLKLGMGRTNVNKVFDDLIEMTPYMGATKFSEKTARKIVSSGSAFIQTKMDGRYANAIVRGEDCELESRGGEPSYLEGAKFLEELKKFPDRVFNGELTIDGIDRYTSNGVISSLISIGKKKAEGKNVKKEIEKFRTEHSMTFADALNAIRYTVWDSITVDEYYDNASSVPYYNRLKFVEDTIAEHKSTMVSLIKSKKISTYDEAMEFFKEMLVSGEEGAILKAADGKWKDGKPNWQCKMKLEIDLDLKIVGFNYGTEGTKNENVVSSLTVQTSDGLLETRPGGISETDMDYITKHKDSLLNTIVTVKCCGISSDRNGNYALLHPVFKELRDDKTIADSLEDVKNTQNMVLGLTKA